MIVVHTIGRTEEEKRGKEKRKEKKGFQLFNIKNKLQIKFVFTCSNTKLDLDFRVCRENNYKRKPI